MGFLRHEYWRGLPFPPPEGLPDPETEPGPPALAGGFFGPEPPGKPSVRLKLPPSARKEGAKPQDWGGGQGPLLQDTRSHTEDTPKGNGEPT